MYWISSPIIWIPLYLFFIYLIYKNFPKQWWIYTIVLVISVGLSDWISVNLFKEVFQRLRPCHNIDLKGVVHIVRDHCGGRYGFVSSHAANMFSIAIFLTWLLKGRIKYIGLWLFAWASIIGYSRIYLGVHYPADIIAGALLGGGISTLFYFIIHWLAPPLKT